MTELSPLPVKGYTDQTQLKVDAVNVNKVMEERILRGIDALLNLEGESDKFDFEALWISRDKIRESFMWLNRGIFNPQRISLPEDEA